MTNHNKYACWYLVNSYKCPHIECNFSHDPYDICIKRQSMNISICHEGFSCKTKCNNIHNYKEICNEAYHNDRKRKRSISDLEEANNKIRKLENSVSKLEYALSQKKKENIAIKEVHKKTLTKEYLDENYLHIKNANSLYSRLFQNFRLNFYNFRDNYESEIEIDMINMINKYIHDMNNSIQFRNKDLHQ